MNFSLYTWLWRYFHCALREWMICDQRSKPGSQTSIIFHPRITGTACFCGHRALFYLWPVSHVLDFGITVYRWRFNVILIEWIVKYCYLFLILILVQKIKNEHNINLKSNNINRNLHNYINYCATYYFHGTKYLIRI